LAESTTLQVGTVNHLIARCDYNAALYGALLRFIDLKTGMLIFI
jgi:hypothetical protein